MADQPTITEDRAREIIREELARVLPGITSYSGLIVISKDVQTQKGRRFGFFGTAPTAQAAAISTPSGGGTAGVDSSARTAINSIITALHNIGITA